MSAGAADQCFCATCNTTVPPAARGTARVDWMRTTNRTTTNDLGHPKDAPWPPDFPVNRRPAGPT